MVSVIVPAYNAEKTLAGCLDSLTRQDYRGRYEVIVVDDGSTDSTARIAAGYSVAKLVRQENAGPSSARNKGAAAAEGEIILFTDSDCMPEPDWISEMLRPFNENPEIVGVKGAYKTRQKELAARFVQIEYEDKYAYMMRNKYIDFIDTYSAGFKKAVFLEMEGYDTEFPVACAEDIELSYRLSRRGYRMIFNPAAIVYHIHPDRLTGYLKKKYKFAYWRMLALRKNPGKSLKDSHTPQMMKLQLLFPPLIIGSAIPALLSDKHLYLSGFILLVLLFGITTASFTVRTLKRDFTVGLLSPALLFCRAAAQFSGVLSGIIYISKRK
ncbi:MAG: glycosyltransferase [Nitrospiraceae bacterium]|nr:MAG: glycosyltransferase [Nitrospiraceae bacterium]